MRQRILYVAAMVLAGAFNVNLSAAQEAPQQITIVSGPQGGSWFPMAAGLAQIFNEKGARAAAEIGAGISNVVLVSQGRAELGFSMSIVPGMAAKAQEPFKEKIDNVYGIASLGNNMVQLLVRADSGVEDVAGLKGKSFGSQSVGSVTAVALASVLEAYGLSEEDVTITRGSQTFGANETKDRRTVGYTVTSNPPTASFAEVTETIDSRFLPISDEAFAKMKESNPGFVRDEMPANTYRGQPEPIPTASTGLILVASDHLSDDEAYWITRALAEHLDKLHSIHNQLRNITVEDLARVEGVKLHPGAARYYKEVGAL